LLLDETQLERALTEELGVPVIITISEDTLDHRQLSAGEMRRFTELKTTPRRRSWLRGRHALKRLLVRMGESDDTSSISFPHSRLSLTHAASYAVAAGADASCTCAGIGVDLELDRAPHPRSARFFLTAAEQQWVGELPEGIQAAQLLRLWTVKEALFKSDPDNVNSMLYDYALDAPDAQSGHARRPGNDGVEIHYLSVETERGFLTVAVYPAKTTC
jgi:4'-phosphopantetheinyl transferase EntD